MKIHDAARGASVLTWALLILPATAHASAPPSPSGPGFVQAQLAGRAIASYPFFEFTRTFHTTSIVQVSIDPSRYPAAVNQTADLYVVRHRTPAEWLGDPALFDLSGTVEQVTITPTDVLTNTFVVAAGGTLSGNAGGRFGIGYDVVVDLNLNGVLDSGDMIDGFGGEAGFYVVVDPTTPGPLAVTETIYSGGTFLGQDLYYPTSIATLGELPLVVIGHGNGHNFQWYDHLGFHLASYGMVVMSHENNTGPGIETASTTTLTNTDYILGNLATIAGGALQGHVDGHRIVWFGHSRGGEGIVRAYDRISDGAYTPANFTLNDIVLLSSICPTDFLGTAATDPHDENYHLWTGGADSDVNGCASCSLCQTFHLHDRARGFRQSISIHGAGHGAFHSGTGGLFATGPCLLTQAEVNQVMRGYALPLVKHYTERNIPAKDYLWRQWESFRPPGAPNNPCLVVDLMYRDGAAAGKFVIDDYQLQPATNVSSSGAAVSFDVTGLTEGLFDDADTAFTDGVGDAMNGMTLGSLVAPANDTTRGIVFDWNNSNRFYSLDVVPAQSDFSDDAFLSFRACQSTRAPQTIAVLEDLVFEVELRDGANNTSTIRINAYGGGIEEPYQRTSCGIGTGWANEFETVRIRLSDFLSSGSTLDLTNVAAVTLRFGPAHGSASGRIGLDDVEITKE